MANDIFNTILNRKIETFKSVFMEDSEGVFKIDGKLFHAQEFGAYRERIVAEIIKSVIPGNVDVKDGFVITMENNISTQCDLILHDINNTPVINDGILNFFPIESVYAIGEVKSIIRSQAELKAILEKLAAQKKLDVDIKSMKEDGEKLITFLVCKKLDFEFSTNFDTLYENVENEFRHNFILSIDDGLITYSLDRKYMSEANKLVYAKFYAGLENKLCEYPVVRGDLLPSVVTKKNPLDPNIHIKMFLHCISSTLESVRKPRIELQNYYL